MKTATKTTNTKAAPKTTNTKTLELRAAQLRILAALAKTKGPLNRKQIKKAAKCDLAWLVAWLGSSDPVKRKANDAKYCVSLITLGYVQATKLAEGTVYALTAKGRKAQAKTARK